MEVKLSSLFGNYHKLTDRPTQRPPNGPTDPSPNRPGHKEVSLSIILYFLRLFCYIFWALLPCRCCVLCQCLCAGPLGGRFVTRRYGRIQKNNNNLREKHNILQTPYRTSVPIEALKCNVPAFIGYLDRQTDPQTIQRTNRLTNTPLTNGRVYGKVGKLLSLQECICKLLLFNL